MEGRGSGTRRRRRRRRRRRKRKRGSKLGEGGEEGCSVKYRREERRGGI